MSTWVCYLYDNHLLNTNFPKEKELQSFVTRISDMEEGAWRRKYEDSNELILQVARGIPYLVKAINSKNMPLKNLPFFHELFRHISSV